MTASKKAACFCKYLCFILLFSAQARAEWQNVGNVLKVSVAGTNRVVLETSSRAKVSVEFFDNDAVRVRVAPTGKFERDFSYAVDYSWTANHRS